MNTLLRRVQQVFLWTLTLFLLMSLLTSSSSDPSILTVSSRSTPQNTMGFWGASVAAVLYESLGLFAIFAPILLASLSLFHRQAKTPPPWSILGWILLTVSLPPLLCMAFPKSLTAPYQPGGTIGEKILAFSLSRLNKPGSMLILGGMLLTSLLFLLAPIVAFIGSKKGTSITDWMRQKRDSIRSFLVKDTDPQYIVVKEEEHSPVNSSQLIEPPPAKEEAVEPKTKPNTASKKHPAGNSGTSDISRSPLPTNDLLDPTGTAREVMPQSQIRETEKTLSELFRTYGVPGKMVGSQPGPVVTLFEFLPAPGTKVSRVTSLTSEISMALKAPQVNLHVPIPGKSTIGLEVPNPVRQLVTFREILSSPSFRSINSPLSLAIGKTINGDPYAVDLARMPHLLIAGATGTGKSVCMNVLIASILMSARPEDVRFIMIDPKRLEFAPYEGIPHLLGPVITDPKVAASKLRILADEMIRRYELMKDTGVRNISEYRKAVPEKDWFPFIVVLIDELADLMLSLKKDVEPPIIRLAQMARAAGIHLILATQRPSVAVLTGLIKANIPTKIAFQVTSQIDSRVILDQGGAESLLGAGDMLMRPPGTDALRRLHGAFISESELSRLVSFWKEAPRVSTGTDSSLGDIMERLTLSEIPGDQQSRYGSIDDDDSPDSNDGLYEEAVAIVRRQGKASTSLIQRHLRIGYNRAARIIERMEEEGLIGKQDGSKPRPLLKGHRNHEQED